MTIMMYVFWYIKHGRQDFLSFWAIFCPFTPLTIQKIKILKKWKKLLEISFTQVCYKWQLYDIWFLRYQLQHTDVFVIFGHVLPFTPLTTQKMKISQNWKKKHLEISSFYPSVPKFMIIGYTVPELWCVPDVIIFHFELFFTLSPP